MPLDFYMEPFMKRDLIPTWDGDGVQGVGQPRDFHGRWRRGVAATLASLAVLVGALGGCDFAGHHNFGSHPDAPSISRVAESPSVRKDLKPIPAPDTAKGYQKMWNKLDQKEWGSADVSLSVPLGDGRVVWLYGDTTSENNGFVHSTAITQTGGRLHVSSGGAQLIPNDDAMGDRDSIYWIQDGTPVGKNQIHVIAAPMSVGKGGVWDFKRRSMLDRMGLLKVDENGDVHFVKWLRWVTAPRMFADLKKVDNKLTYENRAHPEAKLKSHKVLMTVNQNNADGHFVYNADGTINFKTNRPIFYEGDGEHRASDAMWEWMLEQARKNMIADPHIPQSMREVRKREQPAGYIRETEKIRENKKRYGGTVHKFTAAKWTHPNGHPRCLLCGDEENISGECNREATKEEEAAFHEKLKLEFSKGLNPLWDGDGIQGAGQPRDRMGRWIHLPGPSDILRIGAWEMQDGSFGLFRNGERRPYHTVKTKRTANKIVADAIKHDRDLYVANVNESNKLKRKRSVSVRRKQIEAATARDKKVVASAAQRNASPIVPDKGRKPRKPPRVTDRVEVSPMDRLDNPGRPTQAQANEATAHARRNMPDAEAKYAGLIVRLLKNKGVTQDPKKRHELSQRYGVPAGRLVQIEREMYDRMFPPSNKKSADRRKALSGGVPQITTQQVKAMLNLGARKGSPEFNPDSPNKPSRFFRILKGSDRGKWGKVSWNGSVSVISDKEAQDGISRSKVEWTKKFLTMAEAAAKRQVAYRAAQAQLLAEHLGDIRRIKKVKRDAARKWAEENGLDPTDTYWHAFFWNDPSLLQSQNEDSENPLVVNLAPVLEKYHMDPGLLEGILALPEDMSSHKMRGHRPQGRKPVKGDPDFVPASAESRRVSPEWESMQRDVQIKHERRLMNRYNRYKAAHPKSKMTFADFKMRIENGEVVKSNPLWDGDGVQGIGQPRNPHTGRWIHTGGALRAVAREIEHEMRMEHHGGTSMRAARRGAVVTPGAKKNAFTNGSLSVGLKRLPRSGKHVMEDANGKRLSSRNMTPEEAITRRNTGSTAITNQRLKQIWEDFADRGKMPTKDEYNMVVSAGGQAHIDGDTKNIRTHLKSGAKTDKSRADLFTMLRSQWAAGSGDRSHRRNDISDDARARASAKRAQAKKQNSAAQAKKQAEIADLFTFDGKHCICIFCGKPVRNHSISLETAKPKEIGGTYEVGNIFPAHHSCNVRANAAAQRDPEAYYARMMRNFILFTPKEVKQKLNAYYRKHRKHLGTYTDAKAKGFRK